MAKRTLTSSEITTLLSATIGSSSQEDLQNILDALNKKFVTAPTSAINTILP